MCGLAGIYNNYGFPVDTSSLLLMREQMVSRGPDGAGLWIDPQGDLGLAHRRLAIIDLTEAGAQPMHSMDGRYHIVFNGEIYNHLELRDWCLSHGAQYFGHSDTETLLHLYALQGESMLSRLRGMFAFAIWDALERSLLLVRDPIGIKPLYYSSSNDGIAFASQVKALQAGGFGRGNNVAGVVSFLMWGYVTEPHTIDINIHSLPAGHAISLRRGRPLRMFRYRDALAALREPTKTSETSTNTSVLSALSESVRYHLVSDVPIGLFLSAGLDSITLCALAKEIIPRTELSAITLGFNEYVNTEFDEVQGAREISQLYHLRHQVMRVGPVDFTEEREHILAAMDQPTIDGVNTYMVSKAAADVGMKVAFSGLGGDEIFGSYPSYRQVPRMASILRMFPHVFGIASRQLLRPLFTKRISPKYAGIFEWGRNVPDAYFLRRALFMPWELPQIIDVDFAREGLHKLGIRDQLHDIVRGIETPFDQVMALETSIYMRNCLLRDTDWAGMAHSLEIRTPLADTELFTQLIHLRKTQRNPLTKMNLRNELKISTNISPNLLDRKKSGFTVPIREWMIGEKNAGNSDRGLRTWALTVLDEWEK